MAMEKYKNQNEETNAINVRTNTMRGTVKAVIVCFVVIMVVVIIFASNAFHSRKSDTTEIEHTPEAAESAFEEKPMTANDSVAAENFATTDDFQNLKDYVNISPHYYYHFPEGLIDTWEPSEQYFENETISDFTYEDDFYTVRSYMLEYCDGELASIVKAQLSLFNYMKFIDEEYINGKYGEILKIRFETQDEGGNLVVGTGYYWYESVPKICCLEVSADAWHDGKAEEMIKDSIYKVSPGNTGSHSIDEKEVWTSIQEEEAMKSSAEDAMRDYYEQKPDYTDRVLKP